MTPDPASEISDEILMRRALAQASLGIGLTAPNPPVGAVLYRNGQILGEGYHRKAGGPHAEIEAFAAAAAAGHDPAGATLCITLEPCSTKGRTPPCTDAILQARPARVIWGANDPNPAHQGRAKALLEQAGIQTAAGILEAECMAILRPFAKRITTGLPWVIVKAGMSLDGRITRPAGEGQWITSPAAREDAMYLRSSCEAILAGAGTIRTDNPSLTIRGPALRPGQPPLWRAILAHPDGLPQNARIFTDEFRNRTLIYSGQTFESILHDLAERGVLSVLIEGGGKVIAAAFSQGVVDEVVLYMAPLILGSGKQVVPETVLEHGCVPMQLLEYQQVGADLKLRALVQRSNSALSTHL